MPVINTLGSLSARGFSGIGSREIPSIFGTWVAVSSDAGIAISRDNGSTWTTASIDSGLWWDITFGDNKWVIVERALGVRKYAVSTNATAWTTGSFSFGSLWDAIAYGNGLFVAVLGVGYGTNLYATSPDGTTWTRRTLPVSGNWGDITFNGDTFIIVPESGTTTLASQFGLSWTQATLPSSGPWSDVAYGRGVWTTIHSLLGTEAAYSDNNGLSWTSSTMPFTAVWQSVAFGNDIFVAIGWSRDIATSTDGISWTARTDALPANLNWQEIDFSNGIFIAVAESPSGSSTNIAATSPDGVNWTQRTLPVSAQWQSIAYGNPM